MGRDCFSAKSRLVLGHGSRELHRGNPFNPDSSYFTFGSVASVGINAEGA
jgi:hypothetical protein